jgi:prepilin-type N-terminal cleavage/methylation domain-containing protein
MERNRLMQNKGFTIIETLMALAILGISAVGVYRFMGGIQKIAYRTEQLGDMESVLTQASENGRRLLADVGTDSTDGVCRFFRLASNADVSRLSSGVEGIDLELFRPIAAGAAADVANVDKLASSPDLWAKTFTTDKWKAVGNCWADVGGSSNEVGRYQRCYELMPNAWSEVGDADTVANRKIRVQIALSPVKFNSQGNALLGKANNIEVVTLPKSSEPAKRINARDHGFLVTAKVAWESAQRKEVRTHYNLVWAGEFSCLYGKKYDLSNLPKCVGVTNPGAPTPASAARTQCNNSIIAARAAGTLKEIPVYLNPSGIGSGASDNNRSVQIFSANHDPRGLSVEFLDTTFTVANIKSVNGENRAVTMAGKDAQGHDMSYSAACSEKSFRCRKRTSQARDWAGYIDLNALLRYRQAVAQDVQPVLSFRKPAGAGSFQSITAGTDLNSVVGFTNRFYNPTNKTLTINRSVGQLAMRVTEADKGLCNKLCENEYSPQWSAYLTFGSTMAAEDRKKTGCVCCTMKQCAAVGSKTAACATQPIEPQDAKIPECDSAESSELTRTIAATSSAADQCVVAKLNADRSDLEFHTRDCNQARSYLCYAVGRYFVAKPNNAFATGNFAGGDSQCYEMGKQTIQLAELNDLLGKQGNLSVAGRTLPPSVYYDAGLTGLFLAPQSQEMRRQATELLKALFPSEPAREFWVGMRSSSKSRLYAHHLGIPAQATASNAGWVTYYDDNFAAPFLRVVKDTATDLNVSTPNAFVLFHSRRYTGAFAVRETQARALPVLCYHPEQDKYIVTSGTVTNVADAPERCLREGGLFIVPEKPLEWVQALKAIAPLHPYLPWPQPSNVLLTAEAAQPATSSKAAWLALRSVGGVVRPFLAPNNPQDYYEVLTGKTGASLVPGTSKRLCYESSGDSYSVENNNCGGGASQVTALSGTTVDHVDLKKILLALRREYMSPGNSNWIDSLRNSSPALNPVSDPGEGGGNGGGGGNGSGN